MDDDLEQMNRIVDAVMVYYTYFVPVHPGGRTVADFLHIKAPQWLAALVMANREKELPLREARIVDADNSHFTGMLVSSIAQDIIENGGATERGKVVMQIMEEFRKDGQKKEELRRIETTAYRQSKSALAESDYVQESTADYDDDGVQEEEEEGEGPQVIIPFVAIYQVDKKNRVRAILQTYKGTTTIHFFGTEHKVELKHEGDEESTLVAYCYPVGSGEAQVGTRLGALNLKRDRLELSSTVEERHRALRDFAMKLVGQRNLHLVSEMKDAVVDPETGELATEEMLATREVMEILKEKGRDDIIRDGMEVCARAGIVSMVQSRKDDPFQVSPSFLATLLDNYRKISDDNAPDAVGLSFVTATMSKLLPVRAEGNTIYETMVAAVAVVEVIVDRARRDGAHDAARTLQKVADFEDVRASEVQRLVSYLEVLIKREGSRT